MNIKDIANNAAIAGYARENMEKLEKLFNCGDCSDRPLFIEVGGPSTHARIGGLAHDETEQIRSVLRAICAARESKALLGIRAEAGKAESDAL